MATNNTNFSSSSTSTSFDSFSSSVSSSSSSFSFPPSHSIKPTSSSSSASPISSSSSSSSKPSSSSSTSASMPLPKSSSSTSSRKRASHLSGSLPLEANPSEPQLFRGSSATHHDHASSASRSSSAAAVTGGGAPSRGTPTPQGPGMGQLLVNPFRVVSETMPGLLDDIQKAGRQEDADLLTFLGSLFEPAVAPQLSAYSLADGSGMGSGLSGTGLDMPNTLPPATTQGSLSASTSSSSSLAASAGGNKEAAITGTGSLRGGGGPRGLAMSINEHGILIVHKDGGDVFVGATLDGALHHLLESGALLAAALPKKEWHFVSPTAQVHSPLLAHAGARAADAVRFVHQFFIVYPYLLSSTELLRRLFSRWKGQSLAVVWLVCYWVQYHFADFEVSQALLTQLVRRVQDIQAEDVLDYHSRKILSVLEKILNLRKLSPLDFTSVFTPSYLVLRLVGFLADSELVREKKHLLQKTESVFATEAALSRFSSQLDIQPHLSHELLAFLHGEGFVAPKKDHHRVEQPWAAVARSLQQLRSPHPLPTLPSKILPTLAVGGRSYSALEVAFSLCTRDFALFKRILPVELMKTAWTLAAAPKLCPNLVSLIENFNSISYWAVLQILEADKGVEDRAEVIKFFIMVAYFSRQIQSLNICIAVLSGLSSRSISRLERSWSLVDPECLKVFRSDLAPFFDASDNYGHYRQYKQHMSPPLIPFMGIYLNDLKPYEALPIHYSMPLVSDVAPDSTEILYWPKFELLASVFGEILYLQQFDFPSLPCSDDLLDIVQKKTKGISEVKLYHLSRTLEVNIKRRSFTHVSTDLELAGTLGQTNSGPNSARSAGGRERRSSLRVERSKPKRVVSKIH